MTNKAALQVENFSN